MKLPDDVVRWDDDDDDDDDYDDDDDDDNDDDDDDNNDDIGVLRESVFCRERMGGRDLKHNSC